MKPACGGVDSRDSTTVAPCGRFKSQLISTELGTKGVFNRSDVLQDQGYMQKKREAELLSFSDTTETLMDNDNTSGICFKII